MIILTMNVGSVWDRNAQYGCPGTFMVPSKNSSSTARSPEVHKQMTLKGKFQSYMFFDLLNVQTSHGFIYLVSPHTTQSPVKRGSWVWSLLKYRRPRKRPSNELRQHGRNGVVLLFAKRRSWFHKENVATRWTRMSQYSCPVSWKVKGRLQEAITEKGDMTKLCPVTMNKTRNSVMHEIINRIKPDAYLFIHQVFV